ncbi:hypothetical protein PENTCL1PPCAC_4271, partial [Pristionchus entomophagus]
TIVTLPKKIKEGGWSCRNWESLLTIHREKTIFLTINDAITSPAIHKIEEDTFIIDISNNIPLLPKTYLETLAKDTYKFIYLSRNNSLYTLNTDTMEFLPDLSFSGFYAISEIIGVHGGMVTVIGKESRLHRGVMMTARLPDGYY